MTEPQIHRDLGRLEATVKALAESQKKTEERVQDIHDAVMAAKGGWKALVIVGAISSALTGLAMKLAGLLRFDP